ncbi:hypothetical protein [Halovivax limisalsi]|uniref:hypothetical protein n=1 Tax=Halovivax limisalsi TaxID=1453760 RepID=UPI001FFCB5AD|nr:hypothetical protein [Halovivax limisalsi]
MTAVERSGTGARGPSRDYGCYRCDRDVAPSRLFRIDVSPPESLSERYADSIRYCCADCAAGMNLSAFSERWNAHARRERR